MAAFVSLLTLQAPAHQREDAIAEFLERKVFERCRDAVPGFVSARLLRSIDDPSKVCVIAEWTDQAAFEQWMASPQRGAGGDPAQRLFSASGRSLLFDVAYELVRTG